MKLFPVVGTDYIHTGLRVICELFSLDFCPLRFAFCLTVHYPYIQAHVVSMWRASLQGRTGYIDAQKDRARKIVRMLEIDVTF